MIQKQNHIVSSLIPLKFTAGSVTASSTPRAAVPPAPPHPAAEILQNEAQNLQFLC